MRSAPDRTGPTARRRTGSPDTPATSDRRPNRATPRTATTQRRAAREVVLGPDAASGQRSGGRHLQPRAGAGVDVHAPVRTRRPAPPVRDAVDPSPAGRCARLTTAPRNARTHMDRRWGRTASRPDDAGTIGRPYQLALTDTATVAAPIVPVSGAPAAAPWTRAVRYPSAATDLRAAAGRGAATIGVRVAGAVRRRDLRRGRRCSRAASSPSIGVVSRGGTRSRAAIARAAPSAFSPPGHVTSRHAPPPEATSIAGSGSVAAVAAAGPGGAAVAMVDPRLLPGPELPAGPADGPTFAACGNRASRAPRRA